MSKQEIFVVEKVIGRKINKGKTQYLLKWENYAENESTWTPESDCNCKQLIEDYERAHPPTQASSASASAARSSTRLQTKTGDEKDATSTPATGRLSRSLRSATSDSAQKDKSKSPVKAEKTTTRETRRSSAAGKSSLSKAAPSSSDSEKEEEEGDAPSMRKRPFGRKFTGGKGEKAKVKRGRPALSDDDEMGSVTGRLGRSARRDQSSDDDDIVMPILKRKQLVQRGALEAALSSALLAAPYHGRFVAMDAAETRVPAKVFKAKELPGIVIWDRESYEGDARYIVAASRGGDQFLDREVVGIVGYVEHPKTPFVLVKVGLKDGEATLHVKDAVQAVHCPLAERLFPKTYKEYMARVAQLSQPSGSRGTASGAGPSGSPAPTPTGRTTRRSMV